MRKGIPQNHAEWYDKPAVISEIPQEGIRPADSVRLMFIRL
jgi:hypothetical protein